MKATNFAPLLWLMLVLVLIPATLLLLKRSGLAARLGGQRGAAAPAGLVLRDSLVIGPNQRVVALEVGHGAERRLLVLGVTAQQITTLHTLAPLPGEAADAAEASDGGVVGLVGEGARPPFEVMLARVRAATARKPGVSA
jgi:flagellar protein FliO/FliZ